MRAKLAPLLPFLSRRRAALAGLFGLLAASTLCEGLGVGLLLPLIDYVSRGEAFLAQGPGRRLASAFAALGLSPSPGAFVALFFSAVLLTLALKWALARASSACGQAFMRDLREEGFRRILDAQTSHFHSGTSARLVQTLEDDAEYAGNILLFSVTAAVHVLALAVYGCLLALLSWKLTLAVAALALLRYAAVGAFLVSRRALAAEHSRLRARLRAYLIAIHQGIDVVKTFGTEPEEARRLSALAEEVRKNARALDNNSASASLLEGLLGDGALCLLVYLAVSRLGVSGAALLTFLVVITRAIPRVTGLNDARVRLAEYASRLAWLPQALSPEGLPALRWGRTPKTDFRDRLCLSDVSYSYPGSREPALSAVSLELRRGETLALVGPTGAGKSTLVRLLLRLCDPDSGRVTIDGLPLPELRREDWTRLFAVVSQDPFLFDDTLENNVKYGAPACSEQAFRLALRRARAEEFVSALPQKEGTRLGERGVSLSGGERQRLAIARAFLRDSPILVLDEATSAMDAETERLVQDSISELSKGRTALVIAHRFTTIRGADRIAVIEAGRVAECGTHQALMAEGRLYKKYRELQHL